MANEFASRDLSACELLIMKVIWDHKEGDIQLKDLMTSLRDDFDKDYARTTVATFLSRLAAKGYIETYRQGRVSFTHAVKTENEYLDVVIHEDVNFWYHGSVTEMISAICKSMKVDKAQIKEIKEALDEIV